MSSAEESKVVTWARRILPWLFFATLLVVAYTASGGFDAPAQRVGASTRKCRVALATRMLSDADKYCTDAITTVVEHRLHGYSAAEAYGQMAVLRIVQNQFQAGADACKASISHWEKEETNEEAAKRFIATSIAKCRGVIDDVARRTASASASSVK